ncbi:type II toxin-antitoxin system RelE/ParE family toxin [Parasphingorhabdus sp.]|uniref:type II toxin-antitoxin system RelE/ParE family toxin n=1 Tax=Parasphingorhabdus sp. TaxID=2709688 RepID=UPI003C7439D2
MAAQIKVTRKFSVWLNGLRDRKGRARIQARIERLAAGNPGQCRNLKLGVSELKIDVGPGYRVYYTRRQDILIILLCGGDKSTQRADIRLAYEMVDELEI